MMRSSIVVIFLHLVVLAKSEDILVTIPDGTLRGCLDHSWKVPFYAFMGIPYAQPPVGKLRFQPPQPVHKWNGILDVTSEHNCCVQTTWNDTQQSEDCLNLSVYTPRNSTNKSLPVLVNIFGGGFVNGKADFSLYGPHYLMEDEIVIVSINYRVGPFGFLSTGDTVIPGNYGLKDQLLALKWVQKNIKYFNGNPEKVTIGGISAGGASVTYHLMSPKSRGLFRAAIPESGSILCPWAYQRHHKHYAYALAYYLNPNFKKNATSQELLEYLQSVSIHDLRQADNSFAEPPYDMEMIQGFRFAPVIEPEHEDAFITEYQYSAIKDGHMARVPMMMGICSEELLLYANFTEDYKNRLKYYDDNITALVNYNMKITDEKLLVKVGNEIRKLYTPTTFENEYGSIIRYYSDVGFDLPIITHANLQSQYSDVYFYEFSYYGKMGIPMNIIPGLGKVTHSSDYFYTWSFQNMTIIDMYPPEDVLTSGRFRKFITNFVKYLNPTPEKSELFQNLIWPKVTPNNLVFMNINNTLSIGKNPKGDIIDKWVALYEKYAVKPYDTF